MAFVVSKRESIQYDGTNGTAVAAWVSGASLVSDNGTTLVVNVPDYGNLAFTANDHWLVRLSVNNSYSGHHDNAEYNVYWRAIA